MVKLCVSWCPGLPANTEAVALINKHPFVWGIELSGGNDDIEEALAAGLKLSIHTPSRHSGHGLVDANFQKNMHDKLHMFNHSPLATFHTIMERNEFDEQEMTRNAIHNLRFCCNHFGNQRTAFETGIYWPGYGPAHLTDVTFYQELLDNTSSGILFDTSHSFISGVRRELEGNGTVKEYMHDLIELTKGRVLEMHFNVPSDVNGTLCDTHGEYHMDDPVSETIVEIARKVIALNPQLQVITLEMGKGNPDPLEHAKKLCVQAELVAHALGIEKRVEK